MANPEAAEQLAIELAAECEEDHRAYAIWLSMLRPANWVLVGGAAVLSFVAGAEILIDTGIMSTQTAGILALVSTGFTVIHNQFKCEPHQSECRRLSNHYEALATEFAGIRAIKNELKAEKVEELNTRLANLQMTSDATPPNWCRDRAKGS